VPVVNPRAVRVEDLAVDVSGEVVLGVFHLQRPAPDQCVALLINRRGIRAHDTADGRLAGLDVPVRILIFLPNTTHLNMDRFRQGGAG
jgi:hypothetical protein